MTMAPSVATLACSRPEAAGTPPRQSRAQSDSETGVALLHRSSSLPWRQQEEKEKRLANRGIKVAISPWTSIAGEEFQTSDENAYNTSSSGTIFIRFRSPAACRLQLRAHACYLWFPVNMAAGLGSAFHFIATHMTTCPALAVAMDSSTLIHLGQQDENRAMLHTGQKLYGRALHLLRLQLNSTSRDQRDSLLAAISVLQITEAMSSMSSRGADWREHVKGLATILSNRPTSVGEPGFREMLEVNFLLFHFWDALLSRKRIDPFFPEGAPALNQIAETVPGALANCDSVCRAGVRLTKNMATQTMDELQVLENELNTWAGSWNRSIRDSIYYLVPSTKFLFPVISADGQNGTFPLVFEFKHLADAQDHLICCACLLAIKQAKLDLTLAISAVSNVAASIPCTDHNFLSKGVLAAADSLCMNLPFLCEPKHGTYGLTLAAGPLAFATNIYQQYRRSSKDRAKYQWCLEGLERLQYLGVRTLCEPSHGHLGLG